MQKSHMKNNQNSSDIGKTFCDYVIHHHALEEADWKMHFLGLLMWARAAFLYVITFSIESLGFGLLFRQKKKKKTFEDHTWGFRWHYINLSKKRIYKKSL